MDGRNIDAEGGKATISTRPTSNIAPIADQSRSNGNAVPYPPANMSSPRMLHPTQVYPTATDQFVNGKPLEQANVTSAQNSSNLNSVSAKRISTNGPRFDDLKKMKIEPQPDPRTLLPSSAPQPTPSEQMARQTNPSRLPVSPSAMPNAPTRTDPPTNLDSNVLPYRTQTQHHVAQQVFPNQRPPTQRPYPEHPFHQHAMEDDGHPFKSASTPMSQHLPDQKLPAETFKRDDKPQRTTTYDYQTNFSSTKDAVERLSFFTSFQDSVVEKTVKSVGLETVRSLLAQEESKLFQRINQTSDHFLQLLYQTKGAPLKSTSKVADSKATTETPPSPQSQAELSAQSETDEKPIDWLQDCDLHSQEVNLALEVILHKKASYDCSELSSSIRNLSRLLQAHESSSQLSEAGEPTSTQLGGV